MVTMKFQRNFLDWEKRFVDEKIIRGDGMEKIKEIEEIGREERSQNTRFEKGQFFFLKEHTYTHIHKRWNWVDLDWIQSVLTHSVHPSMAPLTSSITFTCTHVRGSHVIERLLLILVSCSVLEFNRASFCKHTN